MIRKIKSRCEHLFKYVFADEFPSWKFPINRCYSANEFVTKKKWEEQLGTVVNVYCKTCSPPNFLRDSQSTDVAKGNDIRRVVVTLKSQNQQKGEYIQKHYTYVCTFMIFWFHIMFLAPSWLTAVATFNQQSSTFERESLVRGHENITPTTYSPWFLWLYNHHHPTNIITLCNIGWLRISVKIRRRRCLAIDVHDCS